MMDVVIANMQKTVRLYGMAHFGMANKMVGKVKKASIRIMKQAMPSLSKIHIRIFSQLLQ